MKLAQLLENKKTEIIDSVYNELDIFRFEHSLLLEQRKELIDTELSAFIDYLLNDDLDIPRSRGRENAVSGLENRIITYLFLSMLEYIGSIEGNYGLTLTYFVKTYLVEYIRSHDHVSYKIIHRKQGQLDSALNIIIQRQQAMLAAIQMNEKYKKYLITDAEKMVIEIVKTGKSNVDMAKALFVSVNTLKKHLAHIYEKTGTHNKVEISNFFSG